MAITYFSSLEDAEVVDVEFVGPEGSIAPMRLLVDSGFTGESSCILPRHVANLVLVPVPRSETAGALGGIQDRGWVVCRVPGVSFEKMMIAIFTDISPLCLPPEADGMVGLSFLRHFARWGAERAADRHWRFFLEYTAGNRG